MSGIFFSKLQKIKELSPAERRFCVRAVFWLIRFKLSLKLHPYRHVLQMADRWAGLREDRWADRPMTSRAASPFPSDRGRAGSDRTSPTLSPAEMGVLLEKCARNLPFTLLCLPMALAGFVLYRRQGIEAQLRIGAKQSVNEGFGAHAWLEHDGEVLVGDLPDLGGYARFDDQRDSTD